jgi:hypothetical protein
MIPQEIISQFNKIEILNRQMSIQTERLRNMLEGAGILSNTPRGKAKNNLIVNVISKRNSRKKNQYV